MSRHYKEHTKPNKFKKEKKNGHNASLLLTILCIIVIYLVIITVRRNIGDGLIRDNKKVTIGWIYSKGDTKYSKFYRSYNFTVDGKSYTGHTGSLSEKNLGDTVRIFYYPSNPKINRCWKDYAEIIREK